MQDITPISVDERRFTIWDWIGFAFLVTLPTLHALAFFFGTIAAIWSEVLVGDFTRLDLIWAIGLTIIAVPALVAFYSTFYIAAFSEEPFTRVSVLLDSNSGSLILRNRHVSGLCREQSLAIADIKDLRVTWNKDEDGKDVPQLVLIPTGRPIYPDITNPADAADLPSFAARLRAELAAAGWSDPSRCGSPQR